MLLIVLFLPIAISASLTDIEWAGSMNVELSKTTFAPGEKITGSIGLMNLESYPILGGQIVIQVASGTYSYPSHEANDNIVYESTLANEWLLPNSNKKIDFEIDSLPSGDYRLDAYAWVVRSKFIGLSSILLSPVSTPFSVSGTKEKGIIIDRMNTVFSNSKGQSIGPVGFPAPAGSEINGKVILKNLGTTVKKDVKVVLETCEWSVVFCTTPTKKEFLVGEIAAGATKEVLVNLTVPSLPSAYEINIIASSNSVIESIYKNRVIVEGPTAKIRKIALGGLNNKNYFFNIFYAGSPDHFNKPDFGAFNASMEIYLEGKIIDTKTIAIPGIKFTDVNSIVLSTTAKSFDKACFKFEQNGITYDYICVSLAQLKEIQEDYDNTYPPLVNVIWVYDEESNSLSVKLSKEKINSRIKLFLDESVIFESTVLTDAEYTELIPLAKKENLSLVVDDFDARRQQVFSIDIKTKIEETPYLVTTDVNDPQSICRGTICGANQVCSGEANKIGEVICCKTECKEAELLPIISTLQTIPLILWIALVLVIIAIFSGVKVIQEGKKK
jgi:hypothetical protein